jgi:hypothetical protein
MPMVLDVFKCWLLGVRDTMVLNVYGWEVFWELLGFYKFWWYLGLGDWNPKNEHFNCYFGVWYVFICLWDLGLGDWNPKIWTFQLLLQGLICFHVFVGFGWVKSKQLNIEKLIHSLLLYVFLFLCICFQQVVSKLLLMNPFRGWSIASPFQSSWFNISLLVMNHLICAFEYI